MTSSHVEQAPGRPARAMTALTLLALLLVAAVPVALVAALVMMLLGYVVGGLALFGGSVLAAAIAVALAGMTGLRHLRKLLTQSSFPIVRLDPSQYNDTAEPPDGGYANLVRLDPSEYTELR
jgi:fatty acid desaturase